MGERSKLFNPGSLRSGVKAPPGELWHKLLPWTYFALALGLITLAVAVYWPLIRRSQEINSRKIAMERRIEAEQARTIQLRDELYALQGDPLYIERMARDVLNCARGDETIFKFPSYREMAGETEAPRPATAGRGEF